MRVALLGMALAALTAGCGGGEQSGAPATGGCEVVEAPAPREPEAHAAPETPLKASAAVTLTFETNCGSFAVALDAQGAPRTAASLVSLARSGYFDDTIFHRIVPGFVIQGGDPTQTGAGGPGYSTVDAPPPDARYQLGTVAMAKTAIEQAGTSGSQFFVVTADDAGLPAEYAIVGRVEDGLDVVARIGLLGDAAERPTQPVVVRRVTVTEGG